MSDLGPHVQPLLVAVLHQQLGDYQLPEPRIVDVQGKKDGVTGGLGRLVAIQSHRVQHKEAA